MRWRFLFLAIRNDILVSHRGIFRGRPWRETFCRGGTRVCCRHRERDIPPFFLWFRGDKYCSTARSPLLLYKRKALLG